MECVCELTPDLSLGNSFITVADKAASHLANSQNYSQFYTFDEKLVKKAKGLTSNSGVEKT